MFSCEENVVKSRDYVGFLAAALPSTEQIVRYLYISFECLSNSVFIRLRDYIAWHHFAMTIKAPSPRGQGHAAAGTL